MEYLRSFCLNGLSLSTKIVSILLLQWNTYEAVELCKSFKIKYLYLFCSTLFSSKFSRSMNFLGHFLPFFRKHNSLFFNNLGMVFNFFKINYRAETPPKRAYLNTTLSYEIIPITSLFRTNISICTALTPFFILRGFRKSVIINNIKYRFRSLLHHQLTFGRNFDFNQFIF
jgi:hypothetical protein